MNWCNGRQITNKLLGLLLILLIFIFVWNKYDYTAWEWNVENSYSSTLHVLFSVVVLLVTLFERNVMITDVEGMPSLIAKKANWF